MERRDAIKGLAVALGGLVMIPGCLKDKNREPVAMCYDFVPVRAYSREYCKKLILVAIS